MRGDFMEIKAKCKADLNSIRALVHLGMFKKGSPKTHMIVWTIAYGFLAMLLIGENLLFGADSFLLLLLGLLVLIYLWVCFLYFVMPRIRYKAMANMKDTENEYVFCEDFFLVSSANQVFQSRGRVDYSLLVCAYESSDYFFLYQTKNQVFVVDKSTIEGGTALDIRNKLSTVLQKKYILCKY